MRLGFNSQTAKELGLRLRLGSSPQLECGASRPKHVCVCVCVCVEDRIVMVRPVVLRPLRQPMRLGFNFQTPKGERVGIKAAPRSKPNAELWSIETKACVCVCVCRGSDRRGPTRFRPTPAWSLDETGYESVRKIGSHLTTCFSQRVSHNLEPG